MKKTLARPANDIESVIHSYGNMLFRLCLIMLGNTNDAEDAVQEVVIKYLQKAPKFENTEHEKAWLIKVSTNQCKDILRFRSRNQMADIDQIKECVKEESDSEIIDALMTLPEKYKIVLILYYVEGYSTKEIAGVIGKTPSAVKMRLKKGRMLLKAAYEGK